MGTKVSVTINSDGSNANAQAILASEMVRKALPKMPKMPKPRNGTGPRAQVGLCPRRP